MGIAYFLNVYSEVRYNNLNPEVALRHLRILKHTIHCQPATVGDYRA